MISRKLPLFDGFIETPFERRFPEPVTGVLAPTELACHCGRARIRQDDGNSRSEG